MTTFAILLVTISAFVHALWNLLSKRQNPSTAFFFLASLFAAICFSPLLAVYHHAFVFIPRSVWGWLGLTSLFEVIYYIGLAGAYRHADMSSVYPFARAVPVILVAILTVIFRLGNPLSMLGVIGILFVVIGCLVLPLSNLGRVRLGNYLNPGYLLAGLAAIGTTGYTLVDNQALFDLRSVPNTGLSPVQIAFFYLALESVIIAVMIGLYVWLVPSERVGLRQVWRSGKAIALLTGLLIIGTYGLVLAAMAYASNVSYILAFRQLSIPLGALLGIFVQKEPARREKLAGVAAIFTGLVLVALA